jgi:hypothetical protein
VPWGLNGRSWKMHVYSLAASVAPVPPMPL